MECYAHFATTWWYDVTWTRYEGVDASFTMSARSRLRTIVYQCIAADNLEAKFQEKDRVINYDNVALATILEDQWSYSALLFQLKTILIGAFTSKTALHPTEHVQSN